MTRHTHPFPTLIQLVGTLPILLADAGRFLLCACAQIPPSLRIALSSGDTLVFRRRSKIQNTPSMTRCENGERASVIRKPLIWARSTRHDNA
jgi:hypothetical protein